MVMMRTRSRKNDPMTATLTPSLPLNVKCKDRAAYLDTIDVQDGWTEDGRRRMVTIPARNSKSCHFDLRETDPGCQGCKWQKQQDPRDTSETAA